VVCGSGKRLLWVNQPFPLSGASWWGCRLGAKVCDVGKFIQWYDSVIEFLKACVKVRNSWMEQSHCGMSSFGIYANRFVTRFSALRGLVFGPTT